MTTGMKVSAPGKDVNIADINDLILHSEYSMFKYHGEYTTSTVFNPGDITKTVSITHGLGYVPAFISYGKRSDDGANFIIPSLPYGISEFDYSESWADIDKIYFKITLFSGYGQQPVGWNEFIYSPSDFYNSFFGSTESVQVGNQDGSGVSGALRFTGITLDKNQSISSAEVNFYVGVRGNGSGDMKIRSYGIDEDNTDSFGYPLGRSKTSAVNIQNVSLPQSGEYFGINLKSQVEEIIARNGWSNGNAIGFIFDDDGSPNNVYTYDGKTGTNSFFKYRIPGTLTVNFRTIVFKDKIA